LIIALRFTCIILSLITLLACPFSSAFRHTIYNTESVGNKGNKSWTCKLRQLVEAGMTPSIRSVHHVIRLAYPACALPLCPTFSTRPNDDFQMMISNERVETNEANRLTDLRLLTSQHRRTLRLHEPRRPRILHGSLRGWRHRVHPICTSAADVAIQVLLIRPRLTFFTGHIFAGVMCGHCSSCRNVEGNHSMRTRCGARDAVNT